MLCESCKKRQATLHYTSVINGVVEEYHLCEVCAAGIQKGIMENFPVHKLFEGLNLDVKCPNCSLSYEKFRATGKLGCSECYDAFGVELKSVIKGIHGHTKHSGKMPKRGITRIKKEINIEELTEQLEDAVKLEEFEKAADLRDEIKRLKSNL
ncbi:MAG: UvrB/UvrC motif-containing protein [Gudongella sp.]|nr:UvrB/UvrC motif-containing protein [Gudongella sp.]